MAISEDISGALRAEEHGHQPVVYGISPYDSGGMAVVQSAGVDSYNQTMDIEVAQSLVAASGGNPAPKVVTYRGDAITNPINASNPKPGDPCHTLVDDGRNYVVLENHPADSRVKVSENGVVQTLSGRMGTGGGNVPMVVEPYTSSKASYHQHFTNDGKAETLVASDYKDPPTVTYGLDRASFNQGQNAQFDFSVEEEKVGSLTARGPGGVLPCASVDCLNGRGTGVNGTLAANARKSLNSGNVVRCESVVRRLTPLECTRLQGFPDGWVDIGEWVDSNGKVRKDSDAPKYKALGNSIALPFWRWLAERIRKHYPDNNKTTMASLFDGIGGFGLVFSQVGIEPVWASEIEDFPIAVTKRRFPDES